MTTRKVLDERVSGTRFDIPRHARVGLPTVKSLLPKISSKFPCVGADATVLQALTLMAEKDIGAIPVLEAGRLTGFFSERDYARNSVMKAPCLPTQLVREIMTPCSVFASLTDSVQACLNLVTEHRLHYLPVLDSGNLVAVLSLEDLLKELVAYLERVFKENELDQQIVLLRGTYSC